MVFPLDSKVIAASTFICPLFALCFSSVAITTVQRPAESIYGHTIPYQVLILGINIWWVFNLVVINTWPEDKVEHVGALKRSQVVRWRWATALCRITSNPPVACGSILAYCL